MSSLLPQKEKRALIGMYRKRFLALVLGVIALLGLVATLLLAPSYFFLRSSQIVLKTKRDTLAGYETSKIATTLAQTVKDINTYLKVFPVTEPASPLIGSVINPILQIQDSTIHISEFNYKPGVTNVQAKVTVLGVADSRADLLAFAEKVKNIGTFTAVSVPISSFIKDTDVSFTLSATVALKQ